MSDTGAALRPNTPAPPQASGAKAVARFDPARFAFELVLGLNLVVALYGGVFVFLYDVLSLTWSWLPLSLEAKHTIRFTMVVAVIPGAALTVFLWLRRIDPRYHAQVLITFILVGAYFYCGALENFAIPWLAQLTRGRITSYSPTFVTILAAVSAELLLGRLAYGKWINPASAYVTGISAGILIKSPELWPFVLCAAISIASKYALRVGGRHLWNPTNFGVTVMLLAASQHTASLSVQYGNVLWADVLIWTLGVLILWKIGKLHIPATFAAVYLLLSPFRAWATGHAWLTEAAPLTGPMYQLFMCFMITDPKTITHQKWSQCLTAGLVAVAETLFRLAPTIFVGAPEFLSIDAAYLALFTVGPAANLIEICWTAGKGRTAALKP